MKAPSGNVTFLFTDIEGSSRLWEREPDAMREAIQVHIGVLSEIFQSHGGYIFKTLGDAFCVAFQSPGDAVLAAQEAYFGLAKASWPIPIGGKEPLELRARIALLSAEVEPTGADYFGPSVNRVARLLATGSGGQILATREVVQSVGEGEIEWRDLGSHRLRDLLRPVSVLQMVGSGLADGFPPLRSLSSLPNNLPERMTGFVGRNAELEVVRGLLSKHKLVTLQGPGGVGKTRLALQTAVDSLDIFPDGVWWVELGAVQEVEQVVSAIADAMGVLPGAKRTEIDAVVEAIRDHKALIVLDNCEHLILGAASAAEAVLTVSHDLKILATSREPLGVSGEKRFRVPPFGVPSEGDRPETIGASEAVRLFVDRAQSVRPGFALSEANAPAIAEICRRLDGIPLAVELAAARLRSLTVEQIRDRLDERFSLLTTGSRTAPTRQQTLRATLEWGHELLSESERHLFRQLGVFVGGWNLETAEALIEGDSVLDDLDSLVEKSLVTFHEEGRYSVSETVREFAIALAKEEGEWDRIRRRHLDFYHEASKAWRGELMGPGAADTAKRIDAERSNVLSALDYATGNPETIEIGLSTCAAVGKHFLMRGHPQVALGILDRLLNLQGGAPTEARADALVGKGILHFMRSEAPKSIVALREGINIYRDLGDVSRQATARGNLATILVQTGDFGAAVLQARAAMESAEGTGNLTLQPAMTSVLGYVAYLQGQYEEAERLGLRGYELFEEQGNRHGMGVTASNIAHALRRQGRIADSARSYRNSLDIRTELKDRQGTAWLLEGIGKLALVAGDIEVAVRLMSAAAALREQMQIAILNIDVPEWEAALAEARSRAGERFDDLWSAGQALSTDTASQVAMEKLEQLGEAVTAPA